MELLFSYCKICVHSTVGLVTSCFHLQQQYYDRRVSFPIVPLAPDLHLEPLNCTTVVVRWKLAPRNSVGVQGYKLFYREESQSESAPLLLRAAENKRTIGGLGKPYSYFWIYLWRWLISNWNPHGSISIAKHDMTLLVHHSRLCAPAVKCAASKTVSLQSKCGVDFGQTCRTSDDMVWLSSRAEQLQ